MVAESRNPRHGPLDAVIGERIRRRRRELALSQSALGAKLGITFQQVQKYENGANRVSATMLLKLADALSLSVQEILQEAEAAGARDQSAEGAKLLAAFERVPSAELRAAVMTLVQALSGR